MYDHATMLYYTYYQLTLTLHLMSPLFTLLINNSNSTTTSEDAERNTRRVHDGERRQTERYG